MTWANQVRILKQQFQQLGSIIGGALINALKPMVKAFNAALSWLIAKVQLVVNAIGKLLGWQMEISDVGIPDTLADASDSSSDLDDSTGSTADNLEDASDSAKSLKNNLLGIDELNIISQDDSSSSGSDSDSDTSSSGSGSSDSSSGSVSLVKDYESDIDSWFELGRKISDTLAEVMESIDWDSIYEKARNFGTNLAEFLNGLITPRLFSALGQTIAGAINTALNFLDAFGETFNWLNFGNSLASGLNKFMQTLDWSVALSAAKNWGKGLATALNTFLIDTDWSLVGQTIANGLNTAVTFAYSFLSTLRYDEIGRAIVEGIKGFLETFDWAKATQTINSFCKGLITVIAKVLSDPELWLDVIDTISTILTNLDVETVEVVVGAITLKGISKIAIKGLTFEKIATAISGAIKGLLGGAITLESVTLAISSFALAFGGTASFDVIGSKIIEQIENAIPDNWLTRLLSKMFAGSVIGGVVGTIAGPVGTIAGLIIGALVGALVEGIQTGAIQTFFTTLGEKLFNWDTAKSVFNSAISDFKMAVSGDASIAEIGLYIVKGIGEGLLAALAFLAEPIADLFTWTIDAIKDVFGIHSPATTMIPIGKYILLGIVEGFTSTVSAFISAISNWYNNSVAPWFAVDRWSTLASGAISGITSMFGTLATWFSTNVIVPIQTFFTTLGTTISTIFSTLWTGIQTVWASASSWFSSTVITPIQSAWGTFKSTVSTLLSSLWTGIKNVWSAAENWFKSTVVTPITTLWSNFKTNVYDYLKKLYGDIQTVWGVANTWFSNNVTTPIKNLFSSLQTNVYNYLKTLYSDIQTVWNNAGSWFETNVTLKIKDKFETLKNTINDYFLGTNGLWSKISSGAETAFENAVSGIKTIWNKFANAINDKLTFSWDAVTVAGQTVVEAGEISLGKLPTFATGGFPEDGLFFANHTEMVGSFSNGKTAVANNAQIVEGIRTGVYDAVTAANNSSTSREEQLLEELIQAVKDGRSIQIDGRELVKEVNNRQARNGYSLA